MVYARRVRNRRTRRHFAVACAIAVLGTSAVAATATATATPTTGSSADTSVTVFLKAPRPAALDTLAAAQGLSRADRIARLRSLVPSAATRAAVAANLRSQGFTITGETTWSVTASGAAETANVLFGTRPDAGTGAARMRAATGALPRVPAGLSGAVSAVYPTSDGPATFHHFTAALGGQDFRNAYTPATVTPTGGQNARNSTIATLQLANFYGPPALDGHFSKSRRAADLHSYANEHGITLAPGQYTAVKVGQGPRPMDDETGGDVEVDLDQESILATAPYAKQQAYFAPNTQAGFDNVFASVYDDVVGTRDAKAPNRHIVAMSVSWGGCESLTGAKSILTLEPILKSLVAAGVTIFASSGDGGIYDCGRGNGRIADVDYPGSSPSVVSVGGSYLQARQSKPNTGTNWHETAWSCSGPSSCDIYGGSGGGESGSAYAPGNQQAWGGFPVPVYQRAALDTAPFQGTQKRLVPDISADGSPRTGFTVYTSNPYAGADTANHLTIGGTSLAAPISAAQLTVALADRHRTFGVGQIHGALYSAYKVTRSAPVTSRFRPLRDITGGRNGDPADRSTDPSVYAEPGYDTVTGVGSVLWSALMPYLLDANRPNANAWATTTAPHSARWRDITASWQINRGADKRLLNSTRVTVTRLGSGTAVFSRYSYPPSSQHTLVGYPGATYLVTVVGRDLGGYASQPATATVRVPVDDSWFAKSAAKDWRRQTGADDVAGAHLISTQRGAGLHVARVGRAYSLRVHTGPANGYLGVYVNGRLVKRINEYSRGYAIESVPAFTSTIRAKRTVTVRALGAKPVTVDAMTVTY